MVLGFTPETLFLDSALQRFGKRLSAEYSAFDSLIFMLRRRNSSLNLVLSNFEDFEREKEMLRQLFHVAVAAIVMNEFTN